MMFYLPRRLINFLFKVFFMVCRSLEKEREYLIEENQVLEKQNKLFKESIKDLALQKEILLREKEEWRIKAEIYNDDVSDRI